MVADVHKTSVFNGRNVIYAALIAAFFILIIASIYFLTIETDEAWILLSAGQVAGGPFDGKGFVRHPQVTSGGLYALIHYLLLRMGLPIGWHRLISVVFLGLTLHMIYTIVRTQWSDRGVALLGTAAFLTVPGLLLQSGLATAEIMSTYLLIAAAWHWTARGSAGLAASAVSGTLFGLSMATRMTALIAAPAIVIWAVLYARTVPRSMMRALVAFAVSLAVYLLCVGAYYSLFRANDLAGFANELGGATGASNPRGASFFLVHFLVSENMFPAFTMAVAAAALILSPKTASFAAIRPLCGLLLLIAVIGWAAWIVVAPIPYLRYLWPALPALWLCGILLLLNWFMELEPGRPRLLLEVVVVSVLATQFALSFRQVSQGDTMTLEWQATRQAPVDVFPFRQIKPFRAREDQEKLASIVSTLSSDAQIYALQYSYPITWLTLRKIEPIWSVTNSDPWQGDRYLILFPSDKNISLPSPVIEDWIEANTTLYSRIDDYSLYRIRDGAPRLPAFQWIPVGALPHPL